MKLKSIVFLSLFLTSVLSIVQAFSPAHPYSYSKATKDGKSVFVMLARGDHSSDSKKLKDKYPSSGLYSNDGSTTPLWQIHWYSFHVDISSDGKYLVEPGEAPQIGDKGETEAVTFYKSGQTLRSYLIKDLVPDPDAMPKYYEFGNSYGWTKGWSFDDSKNRLIIETLEGENCPSYRYTFDVTSGVTIDTDTEAIAKK